MAHPTGDPLALALFSEITTLDQLSRSVLQKALPKGMELSHFSVLNVLARSSGPESPAQLSRRFHVTKAAMTNTLGKLEKAGHVHISPDWNDGRRKLIKISPAGMAARDRAVESVAPIFDNLVENLGADSVRAALPFLRKLREYLPDA